MFSTGKHLAWGFISFALFMMAIRRTVSLANDVNVYTTSGFISNIDRVLVPELLALLISIIMLAGVWLISPLFSERKRMVSALKASQANYRAFLENSIDTHIQTSLAGEILLITQSVKDLLGYTPEELLGTRIEKVYANPEDREKILVQMQNQSGKIRDIEVLLRRKDGGTVQVSATARMLRDAEGRPTGLEGTWRDITETRRTEQINTRLGRIIENSRNEVYIFDSRTLKFTMVNRGARENLGWDMESLSSMTPLDIKPEFSEEKFRAIIQPMLDRKTDQVEFETVHQRKDGSRYDVHVLLQPAVNETPPVFIAVIEDITQRRIYESELRQSQKMEAIGQLTAGLTHDFNNLMSVIMGNVELLESELELNEVQRTRFDSIQKALARGSKLTRSLLTLSRPQVLKPVATDIKEVFRDINSLIANTVGEGVALHYEINDDLWYCIVDRNQLENALLNLCLNARDAMAGNGTLVISATNHPGTQEGGGKETGWVGDYVLIRVSDTGSGMTGETMARLFEPFYTTKDFGKGTGLGLSMVYGFVRQSGGHIRVESTPGRGSTFLLYLPASIEGLVLQAAEPGSGHANLAGTRVLMVEDDEDLRILVRQMLDNLGCEVVAAASGWEALEQLHNGHEFDLLLTDYLLPENLNGRQLADRIRLLKPGIHVLYMSGYHKEDLGSEASDRIDALLLRKPFNSEALQEKIVRTLKPGQ